MTFTSLPFMLFVASVLLLFNIMPANYRWAVLLAGSYLFYAFCKVPYLLLALLAVTFVSYLSGHLVHGSKDHRLKLFWMWAGVVANISLLCWLKYLPFITDNLNLAFALLPVGFRFPAAPLLVALGVSYYVFQGISYIVDSYLDIIEPERHLGYFSLSLSFFPKLLQGPIERSGSLLPQLHALAPASPALFRSGVNLFLWGMFKKVVIADRLASFVDPVYGNVHNYFGLSLVMATYLFALQLYFDFSGYTDMALGIARCFNIRLTQNFNAPYLATSTADFWRRWHISFSSWILAYIFKPLQFSLRDWPRWGAPLALMVTFLISGIWHGASWCFVAWGGIHGVYLASAVLFKKQKLSLSKKLGLQKTRVLKLWQQFATFHLVCFSWIFFRAASIEDALYIAFSSVMEMPRSIALLRGKDVSFLRHLTLGRSEYEFMFTLLVVASAALVGYLDLRGKGANPETDDLVLFSKVPYWGSAIAYGTILYMIVICGVSAKGFIYQQF